MPWTKLFWPYFWGAMWGLGGLTFGLTMRYLGMSLGMAVALGYCAAFGTLMPPIFHGEFVTKVLDTHSGLVILAGVAVCLAGIAVAGMAGMSKEREMPEEQKKAVDQGVQLQEGHPGGDVLRHHERVVLLRLGRRRPDQSSSRCSTARPSFGKGCRCWWSCCWAASRRTSSGACC